MKQVNIFLLLVILLVACSSQGKIESTPTPILIPTQTQTLIPSPTNTSTPIPTITFTPTATLEASLITFDVGEGVPAQDIQDIQMGIENIRLYLRDYLGGDISSEFQKRVVVKIVATGLGNQELGGGGGDATGLNEKGMRPFFDVKHIQWTRIEGNYLPFQTLSDEHIKTAAHEYVHGWQNSLGCLTIHYQPLGDWMNEGIAEYIAYETAIQHDLVEKDTAVRVMLQASEGTGESLAPLQSLERGTVWPGHIGYLGIDYLVSKSPHGVLSLRMVCEEIGKGISVDRAFKDAFGISKQDFYVEFQQYIDSIYIQTLQTSTGLGIRGKITLDPSYPNQDLSKYYLSFCANHPKCLDIPIQPDGTFIQPLDSGTYLISVKLQDDNSLIGWYSKNGLVDKVVCADTVQIINQTVLIDFSVSTPISCP